MEAKIMTTENGEEQNCRTNREEKYLKRETSGCASLYYLLS